MKATSVSIKTPEELQILREGGKVLAAIINELRKIIRPGIKTKEIDQQAENLINRYHVLPAFKGYRGFPNCACISVNEEVVHGIPSERLLNNGDIVSVDIGIIYKDYYVDTAVTIAIGRIKPELQKLLNVTREALFKGIQQVRVGNHLSDISHAVQKYVESNGFAIVRDFVGHGIGKNLHEDPEIPNFGEPHQGPLLREGMVLAIEPMVNLGTWRTKVGGDGWTVRTQDGKFSAHFEHTVAVAQKGPEILTI